MAQVIYLDNRRGLRQPVILRCAQDDVYVVRETMNALFRNLEANNTTAVQACLNHLQLYAKRVGITVVELRRFRGF
jgi:DNA polymerase III delta subunit